MKKVILLLSLLCLLECGFPLQAASTSAVEITKIEKHVFGYDYSEESDSSRVERLEKFAYGAASSGNLQSRINKLKTDMNVSENQQVNSSQNQDSSDYYNYDNATTAYEQSDSTVRYPVVDELEKKIFNKVSSQDDIYSRVSKLEKEIFKKEETNKPLNDRVDKLKTAVITDVAVAGYDSNGDVTIIPAYPDVQSYGDSASSNYYNSDILANGSLYNEISMLERDILNETFPMLPVEKRISQLESKVLQRNYSSDDNNTRVERLAAATEAQKSSSNYNGSKFEKNLATGMQIASFLLMVLAFVL